jgi:hypothetical protein
MDCEVGGHDWHSGRDGGRVIDEQARFGADCEQVALAGAAGAVGQHEVVRQVERVARSHFCRNAPQIAAANGRSSGASSEVLQNVIYKLRSCGACPPTVCGLVRSPG